MPRPWNRATTPQQELDNAYRPLARDARCYVRGTCLLVKEQVYTTNGMASRKTWRWALYLRPNLIRLQTKLFSHYPTLKQGREAAEFPSKAPWLGRDSVS